jgi:hypothetical protein
MFTKKHLHHHHPLCLVLICILTLDVCWYVSEESERREETEDRVDEKSRIEPGKGSGSGGRRL